jgi:hypothetical protein
MNVKRQITIVAVSALALLFARSVFAFPGERMPFRAAHFAHRVAYEINDHVVHPVTHGIKRHLR